MYDSLNLRGLVQNESSDKPNTITQTYNLLNDGDDVTHKWYSDSIRIKRPSGLSSVGAVKFRSFKGEMLPFTNQELPTLRCDVAAVTKTLTMANVDGDANPWGKSRFVISNMATSDVISFTKAWTYDKDEESQVIYNIKECVSIANNRMKTIFPKLDDAYVWTNDFVPRHIVDKNIHLSRANAGSGAVGLISKSSNQVQIFNGNTTYPLDVDFVCTNDSSVGSLAGVRQCFSNYNNSIVIVDYSQTLYTSQHNTRYQLFFNPNTTASAKFSETQQWTYAWSDSVVYDRCVGSVFAIVHDEVDKTYNAVMTSIVYGYYNDGLDLSSPCLFVVDPTATNKFYKIVFELPSWTQFMEDNFSSVDNMYCHILAFNTVYDDAETKLYLYCLCISPNTRNSSQAYYILWRSEIDIANETHGSLELVASLETTANAFKQTLGYHYQYGADVGELLVETTADEGDFYNFGFKYACKVDGTILDIKMLHSSIFDISNDTKRLYYLCETKDHQGQSVSTIAAVSPKDLYDNEGLDAEPAEHHFHAYFMMCDRGNDLEDPYDCTMKGWVRNMSDDHWNWNHIVLGALDQYYLGSSNETDTVMNINTISYVDMTLASSSPSADIWNAITRDAIDYATVPADFTDYYTSNIDTLMTGQCTRPTLILKDASDVYYQISFVLRIYTNPYYFEIQTDARDYTVPSGAYSLMFGPVDWIYNEVNSHVLRTIETLITLRYEFNDLILRCSTFPNIDNVVFSINENAYVDFKTMGVDNTVNELILSIEDSEGNRIDRETLAALYGLLNVTVDWEG